MKLTKGGGNAATKTGLLLVSLLALSGCTPTLPQLSVSSPAGAPPGSTAPSPSAPQSSGTAPSPSPSTDTPPPAGPSPSTSTPTGPAPTSGSATPSTTTPSPGQSGTSPTPETGDRVISTTISPVWVWPGPAAPLKVTHNNSVPLPSPAVGPLPALETIEAGEHPSEVPPYDQLSFRFDGAFPSYEISFVPELRADGSGLPVPVPGAGAILKVVFSGAQAHSADGKAGTITSSPTPPIGYRALTSYVPAGDFEGVLSFGIGVGRPVTAVPQTKVRVAEVEKIAQGRHLYVVAIQLDASAWK